MSIRIDGTNTVANPGITGTDTDTGLQFGTNEIQLVTGGTSRVTVESGGDLTIEDGNLVVASGHGIDFSATSDASSMTSELLDDYEEGTWTPYYSSSGATTQNVSDIVNSYVTQNGRYTKIGRQVFVEAYIALASSGVAYQNGGATNQNLSIAGLPFTASSSSTYPSISVGYFASWPSWATGYTPMGYLETGNSFIRLTHATSGGFTYILTNNVIANSSGMLFSLTYTVP